MAVVLLGALACDDASGPEAEPGGEGGSGGAAGAGGAGGAGGDPAGIDVQDDCARLSAVYVECDGLQDPDPTTTQCAEDLAGKACKARQFHDYLPCIEESDCGQVQVDCPVEFLNCDTPECAGDPSCPPPG